MTPAAPCPWCGSMRGIVHVHGHGQCVACGTNVEPCCSGDSPRDAALVARAELPSDVTPQTFAMLFDGLGGRDCVVTTSSMVQALAERLGGDLDEARLIVEAAERVGIVEAVGDGAHRLQRA